MAGDNFKKNCKEREEVLLVAEQALLRSRASTVKHDFETELRQIVKARSPKENNRNETPRKNNFKKFHGKCTKLFTLTRNI